MDLLTERLFGSALNNFVGDEEHYVVHCAATIALCVEGRGLGSTGAEISTDKFLLVSSSVAAVTLPNALGKFRYVTLRTEANQIVTLNGYGGTPNLALDKLEEVLMDADSPEGSEILSKVPNLPSFLNQPEDISLVPVRIRQDSPLQFTAEVDYFSTDYSDWVCPVGKSGIDGCSDDLCDDEIHPFLVPETIIEVGPDVHTTCVSPSASPVMDCVIPCESEQEGEPQLVIDERPAKKTTKPTRSKRRKGAAKRWTRRNDKVKRERASTKSNELEPDDSAENVDIWVSSICPPDDDAQNDSPRSAESVSYAVSVAQPMPPRTEGRSKYADFVDAYAVKYQGDACDSSLMILANVAAMDLERLNARQAAAHNEQATSKSTGAVTTSVMDKSRSTRKEGESCRNPFRKRMKLTDHDPYRQKPRGTKGRPRKNKTTNEQNHVFKINYANNEW